MKFAEHLAAHITPEWRKQYINYEEMKSMLYYVIEEAPSPESADPDFLARYFTAFDEQFFSFCDRELKKINTFYSEKLAEGTRKYATLVAEMSSSITSHQNNRVKKKLPARKLQELKLAFSEFYLSLILLQNYQNLNFTGFRKILKKHDKLLSVTSGAKWREENVDVSHFYTNKDIHRLISETEATVTMELEGGDRQKAMKRLRVPPLGEQKSPWITFKVGLFSGSFIVLFIAVILSAIFHEDGGEDLKVAFRLYRGPMLLIEFIFLLGVNIYGWRCSGVNHVLIFELDPRNHLSEQDLMEIAAILGVIWTLSLLSFLFSSSLSIPPYVNPLALTFIMIIFLINPLKVFRHEARFWVLRVLGRIFAAPIFHVGFADFWLADQLNSLTAAFLDFHFVFCFYLLNDNWIVPNGRIINIRVMVHRNLFQALNLSLSWHLFKVYTCLQLETINLDFRCHCFLVSFVFTSIYNHLILLSIITAVANQKVRSSIQFPPTCGIMGFLCPPGNAINQHNCYLLRKRRDYTINTTDTFKCMDYSYALRPIVHCLPAWFRFAQCLRRYFDSREAFPHLANAAKYSTTFFVVLFAYLRAKYKDEYESNLNNPYVYLWIIASIVSSCYTYTWDIKMDWGLFDSKSGENKFLREETVYNTIGFYYFAIIEDFILRFSWILSFFLQELDLMSGDLLTSILSPLEVFRRFVWNFFRLENEHLNNCGKFRAVRDISVAPLDTSDFGQVLKMMDDEDGVTNRKKRKSENKKHKEPERQYLINNFDDTKSWRR